MSATIRSDRIPMLPDENTRLLNAVPTVPHSTQFPFLRPAIAPGEIGRLGNYRVIRLLGSGGMGKVFLAEDLTLRRSVALKVMCLPQGEDLLSGWERFLREARALAAINHQNLVTVYQTGQDNSTIYLAMELLEGETLDARIRREAPLDVSDLVKIAEEIATGLSAIHERGLIHRDIKPSNIWLLSSTSQDTEPLEEDPSPARSVSRVKILDFGLVREVHGDTQLTEAGVVVGTPAYMSPEQARGRALDNRTDLFSFGCVLYAMATGRAPFEASTPLAQAAALAADEPIYARKLNPAIPEPLADLIAELLAKNPEGRPASASEVIERLRNTAESETKSEPDQKQEPVPSFLRRHRIKLIALVAFVWLVAGALVAAAVRGKSPDAKKDVLQANEPAPTPVPVEYLRDLPKVDERVFPPPDQPPPPGVDGSVTVGGKSVPHGIFMHGGPPFDVPVFASYALDKKYKRFTTDVAMNDTAGKWGRVEFIVIGDGKKIWRSHTLGAGSAPERCELDVSGVKVLTLEVQTFGPHGGTHGAWIDPRLTR